MKLTQERANAILAAHIDRAYTEAHQEMHTTTGDESPAQLLERERLTELLAAGIVEQVNQNL